MREHKLIQFDRLKQWHHIKAVKTGPIFRLGIIRNHPSHREQIVKS